MSLTIIKRLLLHSTATMKGGTFSLWLFITNKDRLNILSCDHFTYSQFFPETFLLPPNLLSQVEQSQSQIRKWFKHKKRGLKRGHGFALKMVLISAEGLIQEK